MSLLTITASQYPVLIFAVSQLQRDRSWLVLQLSSAIVLLCLLVGGGGDALGGSSVDHSDELRIDF